MKKTAALLFALASIAASGMLFVSAANAKPKECPPDIPIPPCPTYPFCC